MSNIWEDSRFSNLIRDSRFKNLPNYKKQIKIDKRFKPMFDEKKFISKKGVDKYGRPLLDSTSDELRKYYEIDSDDNEESDQEAEKEAVLEEKSITNDNDEQKNYIGDELSNDGITLTTEIKNKLLAEVDFARGEGKILSDSSSDDEISEEEDDEIEHEFWGEIDNDIQEIEESTTRLAFCNMDWDQIKASDIMVLCHSFLPVSGIVLCIKMFVSDFGKKCLKEEETKGPLDLVNSMEKKPIKLEISEDEDSEQEGDSYHMEKLRQYQINKLKYYYAVVECDSKETAEKLYKECDGLEYESTSTKLDLRFIPDDMTFNYEDIKDQCTDLPSNMLNYKPHSQPLTALQQAKVKVTWDETTIERKEVFEKLSSGKFEELTNAELKKFINCSDDEDSNDANSDGNPDSEDKTENDPGNKLNNDSISKYKLLLESIKSQEKKKFKNKYEMEYTWGIDTSANKKNDKSIKSKKNSVDGGYSSDDIPSDIDLNDPYFAEELGNYNSKKAKNKKKQNKMDAIDDSKTNELKLLLDDYDDETENKINRKSKKKLKRKKQYDAEFAEKKGKIEQLEVNVDDNFQVDVKDKRFETIYTSTSYSIDPNNPRFKKTLGMDNIIKEKIKRRDVNETKKN